MDIVNVIKSAVRARASDIIITAGAPVAFRTDGQLNFTDSGTLTAAETKEIIYGILSDNQVSRFEAAKELDFSMTVQNAHRMRVNAYLQRGAVGAVFRLVADDIPSIEELNLPGILSKLALKPQGFIIVAGPTGHGKSTTQAAMIDIINKQQKRHIITIEDPIEFMHKNIKSIVDQREVGGDTHSFREALKHVLRQDPDVVLIGEMRDLESIEAALTAAETGHLVITTLHTNDCVQSIDRILDVFPPHQQGQIRTQLAAALLAVVSQRLVPRADGEGRVCACEVLLRTDAVANLIREEKIHQIYSVIQTQSRAGMITMDKSLERLWRHGMITEEQARILMKNPESLRQG